jgi:hypothetical protein
MGNIEMYEIVNVVAVMIRLNLLPDSDIVGSGFNLNMC